MWYWIVLIYIGYVAGWVITSVFAKKLEDLDEFYAILLGLSWPVFLPAVIAMLVLEKCDKKLKQ